VARTTSVRPGVIAAVDAAALVAFVVVGVVNHGEGLDPGAFVRTGLPLLGAWFGVSLLIGTYRRPGWVTLGLTWIVAVPVGLVIRSLARGGPWGHALWVFGGVAMAFTALFLIGGRLLIVVVAAIRARRRRAEVGS
jgi:hypothetical protein